MSNGTTDRMINRGEHEKLTRSPLYSTYTTEVGNRVLVFIGTPFVAFGWVFYRDPQAGFRTANFPFGSRDDGLTQAGKTSY